MERRCGSTRDMAMSERVMHQILCFRSFFSGIKYFCSHHYQQIMTLHTLHLHLLHFCVLFNDETETEGCGI